MHKYKMIVNMGGEYDFERKEAPRTLRKKLNDDSGVFEEILDKCVSELDGQDTLWGVCKVEFLDADNEVLAVKDYTL